MLLFIHIHIFNDSQSFLFCLANSYSCSVMTFYHSLHLLRFFLGHLYPFSNIVLLSNLEQMLV